VLAFAQAIEREWPAPAIHDSVRAVLRDPVYRRSLRRSFADSVMVWLQEWLERLARHARDLPSLRTVALVLVAMLVLFVVVRTLLSVRDDEGQRRSRRRSASSADDPWTVADSLLQAGRYEEAAHAIYRGVILTIGRAERIRVDPSRTSGDYARELRRRGSGSVPAFRAFTRRFDAAVFGHEGCTRESLDELMRLSLPFRPAARAA
jgi:hypothetical protein